MDYHLHVSNDDPNLFVFYENRRTRKELDEQPGDADSQELLGAAPRPPGEKDVDIQFITTLSDPH